jgi:hypothetical protein
MIFNNLLLKHFRKLNNEDITDNNNFLTYENFKNFILLRYNIKHIEKYNYIKYVKVKRQMIKLKDGVKYDKYIDTINNIIKEMHENNIFPMVDIKKYMYKMNSFDKLIEYKKKNLLNNMIIIRNIFDAKKDSYEFKFKIMQNLNSQLWKFHMFIQYSQQLRYSVNKLISLENEYGIDHKLIEINNIERCLLGKKSEYYATKMINDIIISFNKNNINEKSSNPIYYYETNVNIIKLLTIHFDIQCCMKGELDGMIIIKNPDNTYTIDKIIEVKSSVKSTFEDFRKFILLKEIILKTLKKDVKLKYNQYTFTYESFENIINKDISEWVIYICMHSKIEKSHLYFSSVLKMIDDNFIKDFYINNDDICIINKYQKIVNNRDLIDTLYKTWEDNLHVGTDKCNIYLPL